MTTRTERTEQIIANVTARTGPWALRNNADGGAAAIDFMRNYDARQARTPAQADADRRARAQAILDQMNGAAR